MGSSFLYGSAAIRQALCPESSEVLLDILDQMGSRIKGLQIAVSWGSTCTHTKLFPFIATSTVRPTHSFL